MKNTTNGKQIKMTNNQKINGENFNNIFYRRLLTKGYRKFLSLFFIFALVFVPLMTIDSAMPKAFAQTNQCAPTANGIVQNCSFGGGQGETDLTNQAIDDVIAFYNLPTTDRARVLGHARNEIRSMLYLRLIELIKKPTRTPDEQFALDAFTARIKVRRVLAAQKAQDEYLRWQSGPCSRLLPPPPRPGYQPPAPYSYDAGPACGTGYSVYFTGGPKVPTFEEFQQFGAAIAYQDLLTPEAQDISNQTSTGIAIGIGAAAIGLGAGAAAAIGSQVAFTAFRFVFPFLLRAITVAASTASGAVGASLIGGAVGIVLTAVTFAVMRGITVAAISELPGKLQQAIIDAQNQTINIGDLLNDEQGSQEIYGAFLLATLPDFPATDIPAPLPTDRDFEIRGQSGGTTYNGSVSYVDWDGVCHSARLSGAWFIDTKNGVEKQRLSIQFIDWNGQKRIASRSGGQFIISNPENINQTQLTPEILYKDCASVNRGAKIKFEVLYVLTRRNINVNCNSIIINPDPGTDYDLGAVFAPGAIPSDLQITVNNAASATVNNITVRNLSIDQNYQIKLNIAYQAAGTPVTANFTIRVRDSFGQESSESLTIKKSAIVDNLVSSVPNGNVSETYSAPLDDGNILSSCSPASISITSGALPTGTNLAFGSFGSPQISGTLKSGGLYRFEVTKSYANGERLKRNYSIFVNSNLANLPAGATSWWRAEDEAVDFYNLHNGAKVGSVSYDAGKINQSFKFNGTNGYVQLPDDTFSPSLDFTFETWFKTGTSGVILGQQRAVTPYNNPQYGSTPAIYVDQNGRLRVQMFQSGSGQFVTSQNRVDDNGFHHIAVSYDRTSQTRTVYLDGVNIGSQNSAQFAASNYKYQFGTGYVNDGFVGGLTGWINFNGLIDEPTLYNRVLNQSEISSIFTAGDAGKISVDIFTTPAQTRNTSTGSITITARGGTPAVNYSIDGGATFKSTSSFIDLAPGTYTVVVKDGANRTITRQATVVNPPPTLNLTTSTVSPTCNGAQNGVINILPTGGSGNYEYSVRNGANVQSSNTFDSLNGGTYTPWIRDLDSNTIFTGSAVNLSQPSAFTVSPTNFVNAALNQPYSRTFTVSGGTPPFNITADGADNTNGFQLPAGLNATADGNSITISGTPQQVGTFPILLLIQDQNTCQEVRNFPLTITSTATYGISGRVTNGGQGLANVTITLSGAENRTTLTDASGNYSFATVSGSGNYTITASLNGYTFAQPTLNYNNLSANFTDANFSTAATTYEGDIAGRSTGDGAVNVLDLVSLGRIINNLDAQPANGAEYQRTDVAPRSSFGNGIIDVNDFNQLRDYVVANNPRTPASGAIMPAANSNRSGDAESDLPQSSPTDSPINQSGESKPETALLDPARITAGTVGVNGGIVVPITLNSNGNVSAVQFTISYDPNKLFLSSVLTGQNLPPNTTVIRNTNTTGKVSVVAYLPSDGSSVFPAGDTQLVRLNFTATQNATGFAVVGFTDAPTQLIASDPQANAVTLNNTPGGVSITTVYQISGKVTNGTQGLANVNVYLRRDFSDIASAITDAAGNYSFGDLTPGGNYGVRVQLNGYNFTPGTLTFNGISTNIANADFATLTTTYEGDIAGRPTGDGAVNVLDLVALGRIIANLDTRPADGSEWQRTDVAPAANLGDGLINVQDLVQLGRYAGNLDTLRPAGGAVNPLQQPVNAAEESLSDIDNLPPDKDTSGVLRNKELVKTMSSSAVGTATVSAGSVTATSTNAVVPINMNSGGDAAAIQFTVNYDPAKLSIPNAAAIANRYANTTFIINNNAPGKLGIVAYQPLDGVSVFPTGDIKLFDINFTVNSGASGTTTIGFGNDPVTQTASNPQAGVVQVANTPGTVTLLAPTAAGVSVSGRVLVGSRGLMNAVVYLTDQTGQTKTARTTAFGYFHFDDVPAGQTYIAAVVSKRYKFQPQVISLTDNLSDLNFAAQSVP